MNMQNVFKMGLNEAITLTKFLFIIIIFDWFYIALFYHSRYSKRSIAKGGSHLQPPVCHT